MPTNLPPQFHEVQQRYRAAKTTAEKIACLQEMLRIIPKHKGTEKMQGDLRRRLAKLKAMPQGRRTTGKRESAYNIDREGAGQVVVVGPANVGKSALVAALTSATPEVADFPYTTWQPTPGMMLMENVQIQLIDTPPLDRNYVEPELLNLIRHADLVLLVVDLQTDPFQQLEDTVALLEEHRIVPEHLQERYDENARVTPVPFLVLVNKNDDEGSDEDFEIFALLEEDWPLLPISVTTGRNLERMKRTVFERLEIIRVYTRAPGREPDFQSPFVLKKGGTVEDLAGKIHHDFLESFKAARVWGSSTFEGQPVRRDYVLQDGDVVELHT